MKLWKTIKEIRKEYFFDFLSSTKCYDQDIFVEESATERFLQTIKEKLNTSSEEENINPNIKTETLEKAAEMFIYLNMCPRSLFTWKFFMTELFLKTTPKLMILTMNRLLKSAQKQNLKFLYIFEKIFTKLEDVLGLKINKS